MLAILQKQKEEEEEKRQKQEEAEAEEFLEIDEEADKPVVPAVVNDRLKLFKEGEKQQKEKQEVCISFKSVGCLVPLKIQGPFTLPRFWIKIELFSSCFGFAFTLVHPKNETK